MEEWKAIKGYEGIYEVSNLGRVRSKNGEITPQPNSAGYLRVKLSKNGEKRRFLVHRLVADAFVVNPNPEVNNVVNHLDCDIHNNSAENLEWTTQSGNLLHASKNGRLDRTPEWKANARKAQERIGAHVLGTSISDGTTIYFVCMNDCSKKGFSQSHVCECCKGKRKTHKGYEWKYSEAL